jgi:Conserved TM helix
MPETLAARLQVGDALSDFWRSVLLWVPRAVAFIAILVVGWLVARAVLKLVNAGLERVGFDRAVERGGVGRALQRSRYDASDILAKLAYYAVLLFTLQFAFGVWGPNPISDLISSVIRWLPQAFVAIVIVVVAAAIASGVRDLITGALGGLTYGRLLATIASVFIIALGVIAALNQIGIATTVTTPVLIAVLATIAGILIVGVGGGLVRPMQRRWEGWLERAAAESQAIRRQTRAYSAGRSDVDRQMADRTGAERTRTARESTTPAMSGARPQEGRYAAPQGPAASGAPPHEPRNQGVYRSGDVDGPDETQRIDPGQPPAR